MNKNIAILVSSFDGYSDLWKPLELNYKKMWENCPFEKYIISNFKEKNLNNFKILKTGEDISWSYNLKVALKLLKQDYILLTFDDLFLKEKVNNNLIEKYIKYFFDYNMNYLQFYPSISKVKKVNNDLYEKLKFAKYRNTTVWSLWRKDVLYDLLDDKENAWEFETKGNKRANKYDDFYFVKETPFLYYNLIIKGKYVPIYLKKIASIYDLDKNARKCLSYRDTIKYFMKNYTYELIKKVNRWI